MSQRRLSRLPFGACLKALREEAGLSQEALADLAGMHRTVIGFLESGRRHPRVDSVDRLVHALGVTWEELGRRLDKAR